MHGGGHVWHVAWGCVWQGGMHGRGVHEWQGMSQGACVAGEVCMAGGMCGRGACVVGGHAWHALSRYYNIQSMSRQYASYWNAFLLTVVCIEDCANCQHKLQIHFKINISVVILLFTTDFVTIHNGETTPVLIAINRQNQNDY